MKGRWVKTYEDITEWEWYKDPYVKGLFLHLIIKANYKDLRFKGKVIKRGQLVTTYRHLAEQLNYSTNTVRRCLDRLVETKEIKVQSNNQYTLITVMNYTKYQGVSVNDTQGDTPSDTQGDTPSDTEYRNKELKNVKK